MLASLCFNTTSKGFLNRHAFVISAFYVSRLPIVASCILSKINERVKEPEASYPPVTPAFPVAPSPSQNTLLSGSPSPSHRALLLHLLSTFDANSPFSRVTAPRGSFHFVLYLMFHFVYLCSLLSPFGSRLDRSFPSLSATPHPADTLYSGKEVATEKHEGPCVPLAYVDVS